MKNLKIIIGLVFFLIFSGCIKEKSTLINSYLNNGSSVEVEILFYKSGFVNSHDTIKLKPKEVFNFGKVTHPGLWKGKLVVSDYYSTNITDSTVIIYDHNYKVTHYGSLPENKSTKYYEYESVRNINNVNSFEMEIESISKHRQENNLTYTFTVEDYEFAKEP